MLSFLTRLSIVCVLLLRVNPLYGAVELTEVQYSQFKQKVLPFLQRRFPGYQRDSEGFVKALAALLSPSERNAFCERNGELGDPLAFSTATVARGRGIKVSSAITTALMDWIQIVERRKHASRAITLDEFLTGTHNEEVFGYATIKLSATEYRAYQLNVWPFLKNRFPDHFSSSRKFIGELSDLLPEDERDDFVNRHGNFGDDRALVLSEKEFIRGGGYASKIVQALLDWTTIQTRNDWLKSSPTLPELLSGTRNTEVFGSAPLVLDEKQYEKFTKLLFPFLERRFSDERLTADNLIDGLADLLPEEERGEFRDHHNQLGRHRTFEVALLGFGQGRIASSQITQSVLDWIQIQDKAGRLKHAPSVDELLSDPHLYELFGQAPALLDEKQYKLFIDNILPFLKSRFPEGFEDSHRFAEELSGQIPENERTFFLRRIGNLGSDHALPISGQGFTHGRMSASRVVRALLDAVKAQKKELSATELLTGKYNEEFFGRAPVQLTEAEYREFAKTLLPYLLDRFPGVDADSRDFVRSLSDMLPLGETDNFRDRFGNLGNNRALGTAGQGYLQGRAAASRIVGSIITWMEIQETANRLDNVYSVEELVSGKHNQELFGKLPFKLTEAQYRQFRENICPFLERRFPEGLVDSREFVETIGNLLPQDERITFKRTHDILGSPNTFKAAGQGYGRGGRPSSSIVQAIIDWANIRVATYQLAAAPTLDELLSGKWNESLFGRSAFLLDEKQFEAFKKNILPFLQSRFPGNTSTSMALIEGFATILPKDEKRGFRDRHPIENRPLSVAGLSYDVSSAYASRIADVLTDFAKTQERLKKISRAPSVDEILSGRHNDEIFGGLPLSLTEFQYRFFMKNVLPFLIHRFPSNTSTSHAFVSALADLLPESQRVTFRERHGNLGNPRALATVGLGYYLSGSTGSRIVEMLMNWIEIQKAAKKIELAPSLEQLLSGAYNEALWGKKK